MSYQTNFGHSRTWACMKEAIHSLYPSAVDPDGVEMAVPALVIEFPQGGQLRSRKVVSRSNARCSGKYPGFKSGRMHQYESQAERQVMELLDACPYVVSFNEQPCKIIYTMDGEKRHHFPDLLVQTIEHQKEFWEIKSTLADVDVETQMRTAHLAEELKSFGYGYRLVILDQLPVAALQNARMLLRLGRAPAHFVKREKIRRLAVAYRNLSWSKLEAHLGEGALPMICWLILKGQLTIDHECPLTAESMIRWSSNWTREGRAAWLSLVSCKAH